MGFLDPIIQQIQDKFPEVGEKAPTYVGLALRWAERFCGRKFELGEHTETIKVYNSHIFVSNPPLKEIISVGDYHVEWWSEAGVIKLVESVNNEWVTVKYVGGYSQPPEDLVFAISELAYFLFKHEPHIQRISSGDFNLDLTQIPQVVLSLLETYRGVSL